MSAGRSGRAWPRGLHAVAAAGVALGLAALALLAACDRTPLPHPPEYQATLSVFARPVPVPWTTSRDELVMDPATRQVDQALDTLLERSEGLANPPADAPEGLLREVEQLFVGLGRFGDLLNLYGERVAAEGPSSDFAPRLAVLESRLGYMAEAHALVDGALAAQSPPTADTEAAAAILLLEATAPDDAARVEAARHLMVASQATPAFSGIFTYDPDWVDRALQTIPSALRAAAQGDGVPLAAERIDRALLQATEAASPEPEPEDEEE